MSDVFDEIVDKVRQLSPLERVKLVEEVMSTLEHDIRESDKQPRKSLYGLCADLGPAPSAEDIDQARQEMWSNFPREDI